jgi:glycosyltransferase involved in cell wall biosynthesis
MSDRRENGRGGKKVCMLSSVHSAFDVRIYEKEAKSLVAAGYEVAIVVPHEKDEEASNVQIKAVPRPQNRRRRMTRTIWEVYRRAEELGASVYHFHDPELIPVGLLLKLKGKRVVYDVHEDLPRDILDKDWISPALAKSVATAGAATELLGGLLFDGIIAATPTIAARFPQHKTIMIQNFPRLSSREAGNSRPRANRRHVAVFVGGLTRHRGAREMVLAMSKLPKSSNAKLVMAGEFDPPALEAELRALPGWLQVEYHGWQPRTKIDTLLSEARLGLVLFHPFQNYIDAQPNKLFEYMSAGIPVIASDFPAWRELISTVGCGVLVDPLDAQAIADAIQWMFDHAEEAEEMGKRGAAAVRSRYNWHNEERKLLELYARLINGHKS